MRTGIYEILNTTNGKRYIGSAAHFRQRFNKHRRELSRGVHHSQVLQRAWNKYGPAAFVFRPLLICTADCTRMYEQRCFDEMHPEYNVARDALAPMQGRTHSLETRAQMSRNMKGKKLGMKYRPRSAEHCAKMSAAQIGKVVSAETRAKISLKLMGCQNAVGKRSAESRARMSAAQKKRAPPTAETRAKLSAAGLRRYSMLREQRK